MYIDNSKPKAQDRGFTLVELMIVIAVIGILAAGLLAGLPRIQSGARDTRRVADLNHVAIALEAFFNARRAYPGAPGTGLSVPSSGGLVWAAQTDTFPALLINAGIGVSRLPVDPLNRGIHQYRYSSTGLFTSYILQARLENVAHGALVDDIDGPASAVTHQIDCRDSVTVDTVLTSLYCIGP